MTKNIISLTTIPPRFALIEPTLRSLLDQNAPIDEVILWIPKSYSRFDLCEAALENLPDGVQVRRCDVDYGPATKVLPAVHAFRDEDVRILYCDDDRIYAPDWAASLLAASDDYPQDCIAKVGEPVEITILRATIRSAQYRRRKRLTLGIYGRNLRERFRQLNRDVPPPDIAKGFGGVLVRPSFISEFAFNIPEDLSVVDDIWLSGCLAVKGVNVRTAGPELHSSITETAEKEALIDLVHRGRNRNEANLACVRYFQNTYGIWKCAI